MVDIDFTENDFTALKKYLNEEVPFDAVQEHLKKFRIFSGYITQKMQADLLKSMTALHRAEKKLQNSRLYEDSLAAGGEFPRLAYSAVEIAKALAFCIKTVMGKDLPNSPYDRGSLLQAMLYIAYSGFLYHNRQAFCVDRPEAAVYYGENGKVNHLGPWFWTVKNKVDFNLVSKADLDYLMNSSKELGGYLIGVSRKYCDMTAGSIHSWLVESKPYRNALAVKVNQPLSDADIYAWRVKEYELRTGGGK